MAKFTKKGWSSDTNYANFSADGLERYVDKSRPVEELQALGVARRRGQPQNPARRRGQATGRRRWPQNPPAAAEPQLTTNR